MDELKVTKVEYSEGKQCGDWIYLTGDATLTLEDETEVYCIGGIVFADKL